MINMFLFMRLRFERCLISFYLPGHPSTGNAMTTSVVGAVMVGMLLYVLPLSADDGFLNKLG